MVFMSENEKFVPSEANVEHVQEKEEQDLVESVSQKFFFYEGNEKETDRQWEKLKIWKDKIEYLKTLPLKDLVDGYHGFVSGSRLRPKLFDAMLIDLDESGDKIDQAGRNKFGEVQDYRNEANEHYDQLLMLKRSAEIIKNELKRRGHKDIVERFEEEERSLQKKFS